MSAIKKRFLKTQNWRSLDRDVHAEEETIVFLHERTEHCWKTGSVLPTASSSAAAASGGSGRPTIKEFLSVNQHHKESFGRMKAKYNSPKFLCGPCATATALVLCEVLSENNNNNNNSSTISNDSSSWWNNGALNPKQIETLLNAVSNPEMLLPLVENVLHYMATDRVSYIQSDVCSPGLRASLKSQNDYLSEWAANFELSDFVRIFGKKVAEMNDNNKNNNNINKNKILVVEDPNNQKPFGETPNLFRISSNNNNNNNNNEIIHHLPPNPTQFVFMRSNLYPIADQAKHELRQRIELEDKQFGGESKGGYNVSYKAGESAFFVDVLFNENFFSSSSSTSSCSTDSAAASATSDSVVKKNDNIKNQNEDSSSSVVHGATVETAINVDDDDDDQATSSRENSVCEIQKQQPQKQQQQQQPQNQNQNTATSSSRSSSSSTCFHNIFTTKRWKT